jgi:hypothetical protein
MPKRILYASIGLMAIVAAVTIADIAGGWIFSRNIMMDVFFLVSAGIVIYLSLDALKDQK